MKKGLMEPREDEIEDAREDGEGKSAEELDSDILFNSALAFLGTPEGTDGIVRTITGAKDVGTAVGKMAAMVIARIKKELENVGVNVTEGGIYNADGGLTKVLAVVYTLAKANGVNVEMADTFTTAFEVAEADLSKMDQMGQQGGPMPQPTAPGPGLMAGGGMPNGPVS
jgi:hypothetical protein